MTGPSRVVVVGGSIAGVSAALAMREEGFDGKVTIVDSGAELPYERPPLSKSLASLSDPRPIVPVDTYTGLDVELRLGRRAQSLDTHHQHVVLDDGERIPADRVLLATGVSPRRLGVPGETLDNVLTLRDIGDARALGARLAAGGALVVIGGGFIGLEAAALARQQGLDVTVVEAGALPLEAALGRELAAHVHRVHVGHGVEFRTQRTVSEFRGRSAVEQVVLDDGSVLEAATVLIGCGVVPNDSLAQKAGVHCRFGVVTDEWGRTDTPWIRAAGDVANFVSPFSGRRERIEHWDVARHRGAAVGANMVGAHRRDGEAPYFWSDQYSSRIQMFGRAGADDRMVIASGLDQGRFLAFWLRGATLAAAAGWDSPKELRAAKALIESRQPVSAADLAQPSAASLRALGRATSGIHPIPTRRTSA